MSRMETSKHRRRRILLHFLLGIGLPSLLLGYLAGGLVGGVFLIMDVVEKTFFGDRTAPVDAEVLTDSDDPLGED